MAAHAGASSSTSSGVLLIACGVSWTLALMLTGSRPFPGYRNPCSSASGISLVRIPVGLSSLSVQRCVKAGTCSSDAKVSFGRRSLERPLDPSSDPSSDPSLELSLDPSLERGHLSCCITRASCPSLELKRPASLLCSEAWGCVPAWRAHLLYLDRVVRLDVHQPPLPILLHLRAFALLGTGGLVFGVCVTIVGSRFDVLDMADSTYHMEAERDHRRDAVAPQRAPHPDPLTSLRGSVPTVER